MAVSFQLVIDCADPEPLARFWAAALGYELEPPPAGFASWDAYWRDVGVPADELGTGADCIVDPGGRGPRIWFQVVPDRNAARPAGSSTGARPRPAWASRPIAASPAALLPSRETSLCRKSRASCWSTSPRRSNGGELVAAQAH